MLDSAAVGVGPDRETDEMRIATSITPTHTTKVQAHTLKDLVEQVAMLQD